jgi:TetR/AcrR family transcriptional repressor of nem operon
MPTTVTNTGQDTVTRQVILQAAYEEIHMRGFQAASLSKILANTNVTKGALYHYFPTKLALGYAVVDEILAEQIQQQWVQPLLQIDDPVSGLIQIIMQAGQELTEEEIYCGCLLNNLAQEMASVDEGFRSRVEFVYETWRKGTEQAFKNGQDNGFVKKNINTTNVSIMVVASLEGCMGLAKNSRSKKMLFQCGESVMDYLRSLRA